MYEIKKSTFVSRPLEEVFEFFSKAENLQELTPDFVGFKILTPLPIEMKKGTLIDYSIKVHGMPMKWRTLISAWEPNKRFVDEQLKGPYKKWHHEHSFEAVDGGTLIKDHVTYDVWFGFILVPLMIRKDVEKIFGYREEKIREIFPDKAEEPAKPQIAEPVAQ